MRARLARNARRLVVRPATASSAHSRHASFTSTHRPSLHNPQPCLCSRTPRRTFFKALFQKPPREIREPEYEPGWMAIMIWRSRMLDKVRPQPRRELMDAWRRFIESKLRSRRPLNGTQALQCRRLLEYLHRTSEDDDDHKPLSLADLAKTRQVLLDLDPNERTQHHVDFAEALYTVLLNPRYATKPRHHDLQWSYLVQAMATYGASSGAADMLYAKWNDTNLADLIVSDQLVVVVARGLAREGLETELVELVEFATNRNVPYDAALQEILTTFFAEQDRIPETKEWFGRSITQKNPKASTFLAVAAFARRNQLQTWALPIFRQLGKSKPRRRYYEVMLQGLLLLGTGMSDVKMAMADMTGPEGPIKPSTSTINGLLRAAADTGDLNLAEQISNLSTELHIEPDGETFLILWRLQLACHNLEAAERPYQQVQRLEPWDDAGKANLVPEYEQNMNQYLLALCRQTPPKFPYIVNILETVNEQAVRLEPSTVSTICLRLLENEQHFDVMDTLSSHSFLYSAEEREVVQTAFIHFCLNPSTSTSRAWGGYQILQQFFQDLSYEHRVDLMKEFLRRRRTEMAGHVFGHMRAHRNKDYHPRLETYIICLEGIARDPNSDTLSMVHNMLKMDTTMQPTTQLLTALMLAYTACDKPITALDFWTEIVQSRDGPSYASLQAVFWTLQRKSRGYIQAQVIWDKLVKMDVEVGPEVYAAYVGAIAAGGDVVQVERLINGMSSAVGEAPDIMSLAAAYNALPGQSMQKQLEEWASQSYRQLWAELLKKGRRMNEYHLCQFKVERIHKSS